MKGSIAVGILAMLSAACAHGATLYKCVGADGRVNYVSSPIEGSSCVAISQYAPRQPWGSPSSILEACRDAPQGNLLSGPSLRAEECTRVICETPKLKAKIKAYALSEPQSERDSSEAATCLMRKKRDSRSSP